VVLRDETLPQVLELLQRLTGKSILRPQALPAATYSLSLPAATTRDEALQALETVLSLNGVAVIAQGERFIKVVPNAAARAEAPSLLEGSTLDLAPSGKVAAKIFHLRGISVDEASKAVAPMLNGTLAFPPVIFTRTNSLLLTDSIANLQRIERVLAELQRPRTDVLTRAYDLKFANAALLARSLQQALASPLIGQPAFGAVIAPDERTNRVLVTGNAEQQDFVADLVAKLDVKSDPSTRTEVLPLRHAAAPDVATLLTQLITGQNTAARAQAGGRTPANATNRTPAPATNAAATTTAAATSGAEEFSQGVTVVADTRSNAIVASGTADDLRLLRALVEQVDVLLAQVRIEVVIAEVTLTDNASSGIQQLGLTVTGSKLTGFSGAGPGFAVTNGAVLAGSSTDLSATIGLTSTPRKSDTNILSNPSVTTTHNKEATIFVGESRPVVTGTTATPTGATLATSSTVAQRDIGIELRVLPLIGPNGSVQLQISQKVEDILGTVILDGNEQPRIGRRETQSFVSARTGEIIVLGGLQRTQLTQSAGRLAGIPLLGDLLGSSSEERTKTELLIFLRPYVLSGTAVDNTDALRILDASVQKEPARAILDNQPGQPAPAEVPEAK
jgi:general secretion pathway protein D